VEGRVCTEIDPRLANDTGEEQARNHSHIQTERQQQQATINTQASLLNDLYNASLLLLLPAQMRL
jgi:hypothetical protein